jgi:hypothetical protein
VQIGASLNPDGSLLSLSWPAWAAEYTLWETTTLSPPAPWQLVTNAPQGSNDMLGLSLPVAKEGLRYFRLKAP